ncbi:MAG: 3-phosphoshikimate 1-carboxyvinyltransferase [Burkholderiaceae bacterium]
MKYRINPGALQTAAVRVPGDKSISHRAIMLGSIADGVTDVRGFLEGEDALSTMNAFRALGVRIEGPVAGRVRVQGVGLHGLRLPPGANATDVLTLDCGNSGTSMRLMAGLLAGQGRPIRLTGDASLARRPMKRIIEPLGSMGAQIDAVGDGLPPLVVRPVERLQAIDYRLPMASAQVKSSILLAGLYADGLTSVTEPAVTRDHTERMLRGFGVAVDTQGARVQLRGGQRLKACAIDVPADISSAAFLLVAGAIAAQAELTLEHVGVNPTRTGILDILGLMGARIELRNQREVGGEPVADLVVRASELHGIDIPEHLVPLAIDEFPVIFVAAANAHGTTVLRGAAELRVKESDRIAVMADGLQACGIDATPTPDGMVIVGAGERNGARYRGAQVQSHGDHRIAMAFTVAALRASSSMEVLDCKNVATSFPGFVDLMRTVGFDLEVSV